MFSMSSPYLMLFTLRVWHHHRFCIETQSLVVRRTKRRRLLLADFRFTCFCSNLPFDSVSVRFGSNRFTDSFVAFVRIWSKIKITRVRSIESEGQTRDVVAVTFSRLVHFKNEPKRTDRFKVEQRCAGRSRCDWTRRPMKSAAIFISGSKCRSNCESNCGQKIKFDKVLQIGGGGERLFKKMRQEGVVLCVICGSERKRKSRSNGKRKINQNV